MSLCGFTTEAAGWLHRSKICPVQMSRAIQEETHLQKQITDSLVREIEARTAPTLFNVQQSSNVMNANRLAMLQGETLERSTAALKQGMRKLNKAYKQSKSNHLLYLVLFALAIFTALYLFAKAYRTIRWFV